MNIQTQRAYNAVLLVTQITSIEMVRLAALVICRMIFQPAYHG